MLTYGSSIDGVVYEFTVKITATPDNTEASSDDGDSSEAPKSLSRSSNAMLVSIVIGLLQVF